MTFLISYLSQWCVLRVKLYRYMARVRNMEKALEGDGSPSNQEEHLSSPLAAAAASASSSSNAESGKISGLDGSASSHESGSSISSSNSDASSDSDSGDDVEIMLSDTDAKKCAIDVEEGEIGEGSRAVAAEESGENLANVIADPRDLVKSSSCFMGWSLMTQADLDAMVRTAALYLAPVDCPVERLCRNPGRTKASCLEISLQQVCDCLCRRGSLTSLSLTRFRFIS
jgi:hypothetical protein